ncbi:MAG TPA: exodeoxyribonuclease III [Kofleriaceae bacterium]|nr:exodeoxyribonuclease III [Kofleriaceae bacterium]
MVMTGQLELFGAAPASGGAAAEERAERPRMETRGPLKVATWNVNGIRKRHEQVIEWLARERPDVVCLQEIKAPADKVPPALTEAVGDYHAHWHGTGGYSGVALLLGRARFGDAVAFEHPPFDMEQRIVVAHHASLVFASVYIPNGGKSYKDKLRFVDQLIRWAAALRAEGRHLVLCGDFNVAHTDQDVHPSERKQVIGQLPEERARLDRLFADGALVDVLRRSAPDDDRLFTWWAPWRQMRERNIGWRLDYIAASSALVDDDSHAYAFRDVGTSDHGPVIAHLRATPRDAPGPTP